YNAQPAKGGVFDTGTAITVTGTPVDYDIGADAATAGWEVAHLLHAEGFAENANNGLKEVTGVTGNTIEVAGLVAEATPPADAIIRAVGIQFGSGELDVVKTGGQYPQITRIAGTLNFTDFNIVPGSRIFIPKTGTAANRFVNAENNGWMRVLSVTATTLTLDRVDGGSDGTTDMVNETGTGLSIRIFLSDRIVDTSSEDDADFNKITHFIERRLGVPNPAGSPGVIQTEDIEGALVADAVFSVTERSKAIAAFTLVAIGSDEHTGEGGDLRTTDGATILQLAASKFFNNSRHLVRSLLALYPDASLGDAAPDPLIGFVSDYEIAISNNAEVQTAVGRAAGFDVNANGLIADISINSYFTEVATRKSIRANDRAQLEFAWQRAFGGRQVAAMMDFPAASLGNGQVQAVIDQSLRQPITFEAAESDEHDQTMSFNMFWYIQT
ncbi:MAG: hypothetical protein OEU92_16595, partial [Alphaproteobacteria bacterium]|nr:hypothetical protein [Alphaproteobacteria bacterium]